MGSYYFGVKLFSSIFTLGVLNDLKLLYRYYDDAACVLRKMFLDAKAPHLSSTIPPVLPWKVSEPVQPTDGLTRQGSGIIGTFGQSEELRCVIAIVRQ